MTTQNMPDANDVNEFDLDDGYPMYAQVLQCPNCGAVTTYTQTCQYCGEHCE